MCKIVKMIMERIFAPVIVFSFSKKDCEAYATEVGKVDFNTGARQTCMNSNVRILWRKKR